MRYLLTLILGFPLLAFGAAGDITGVAIETNGWQAVITISGLATNGTFDLKLTTNTVVITGITNEVYSSGSSTPVVNFSSSGFDDSGSSSAISRSVFGTRRVRMPYPNQTYPYTEPSGSDVIIRIALSDQICSTDSGLTANIPAGLYTSGGTPNSGATGIAVTNGSLSPQPRTIAMWRTVPYQLYDTSAKLKVVARHISAQQMRPVRGVAFWAVDSVGTYSATNIVLRPTIDSASGDPVPVCEYVTTLDYSAFVQGRVTNHFKAFPWYGQALDTSDGVHGADHPDYGPLVTCKGLSTWPTVYACVDATNGVDANGVCVTNMVSATNGTAVPFLTMAAAINAAGSTNNAKFGSNTLANCIIFLTNGTYAVFGGANITSRNAGSTWGPVITTRPDADWTQVFLDSVNNNLTGAKTDKIKVSKVVLSWNSNANPFGNGYGWVWIDQCRAWTNSNQVWIYTAHTNAWMTLNDIYRLRGPFTISASYANSNNRVWGNIFRAFRDTTSSSINNATMLIGNAILATAAQSYSFVNDNTGIIDPFYYAFNKFFCANGTLYTVSFGINLTNSVMQGGVFDQNVLEVITGSPAICLDVMYSQRTNEVCTNVMAANNTVIGIYHPPYDYGYSGVTLDHYQDINSLYAELGIGDDIASGSSSATNRWLRTYSVDSSGNAMGLLSAINSHPSSKELGFDGLNSLSITNYPTIFGFITNGFSSSWGGSGSGQGLYRIATSSPLTRMSPSRVIYPFDIDGNARGGFDPPGAYASAIPRKGAGFFSP